MELTHLERVRISNLFNQGGWVLDFSDWTFGNFTAESIGENIQAKYALSKGKSLDSFFADKTVTINIKMKLLKDLLEYHEIYKAKDLGFRPADVTKTVIEKQQIQECETILQKRAGIILTTNTTTVQEKGLKELLEEAQQYRGKDNKVAVEKLWDAFERLKTYYCKPSIDKKASATKIINDMSHTDINYTNLFNEEFKKLTDIGNDYRIRHHETTKIDIIDDNYFNYFFNRCLALMDLAMRYLK